MNVMELAEALSAYNNYDEVCLKVKGEWQVVTGVGIQEGRVSLSFKMPLKTEVKEDKSKYLYMNLQPGAKKKGRPLKAKKDEQV